MPERSRHRWWSGTCSSRSAATGAYAALDARSGKILWSFPTTAPTLAPSIAIGNLVVTADYAGTVRVFGPPSLRGG